MKKTIYIFALIFLLLLNCFSVSAYEVVTESPDDLGFVSSSFLKQGRIDDRAIRYTPWILNYGLQTNEEAQAVNAGEGFQQISDIAISPFDNNLMLFGTDTSGIWRTTDGGSNWISVNDGVNCWGVHDIIFHPTERNLVYMISGAANSSAASMQIQNRTTLDGLYKSTDGGKSWKQILHVQIRSSVKTNRLMGFDEDNNFYLLTAEGLLKTADNGNSWIKIYDFQSSFGKTDFLNYDLCISGNTIVFTNNTNGIFVSFDKGMSWQTKNPDSAAEISAYGVDVDPEDANHWICCFGSPYYELYETENAGQSWTVLLTGANTSPDSGRHPLKVMYGERKSNGKRRIYMLFERTYTPLRISEDEGITWSEANYKTPWNESYSPLYGNAFCFDGNDEDTIYLGVGTILKSTDGGYNFVARNTPGFSGAYVEEIVFSQSDRMYLSVTDRGFYKADNIYQKGNYSTFTHNRDQSYSSVGSIGINPENENHIIYAASESNNYKLRVSNDGGSSWSDIAGTESPSAPAVIEFHPENENIIYTTYFTSQDSGQTWNSNNRAINAVSSVNSDVIYSVDNNVVYRSANCGESYSQYYTTDYKISYIMCDNTDEDKIYLGLINGNIAVYDGTGEMLLDETNGLGDVAAKAMAQNPDNPLHIVMGGHCVDRSSSGNYYANYCKTPGIFETYDGGVNWHIVKGIPSMRVVYSLAFSPNSHEIFIGGYTAGFLVYDYEAYKDYLDAENSINEGFITIFNSETNKVNISGSINAQESDVYSTILVLPNDIMPEKATKDDIIYLSQVRIEADGSFEYEFRMPEDCDEGVYSVYLGGSGVKLLGVDSFNNGFFEVCDFEFLDGDNITASLSVSNTTDESKNFILLVAQYDKDSNGNFILVDLATQKHSILPGEGISTKTVSAKKNKDADCYRAFAWESYTTMVPLTEFIER